MYSKQIEFLFYNLIFFIKTLKDSQIFKYMKYIFEISKISNTSTLFYYIFLRMPLLINANSVAVLLLVQLKL